MTTKILSKFSSLTSLAALALTSACARTNSGDVSVRAFYVDYSISADVSSGKVDCLAYLQDGEGLFGTQLELSGDDHLSCSVGSHSKDMSAYDQIVSLNYEARGLPLQYGSTYSITFSRGRDIYTATVELPGRAQISSPSEGAHLSLASGFSANWLFSSGSQGSMTLSSQAECPKDENGQPTECDLYVDHELYSSSGSTEFTAEELSNFASGRASLVLSSNSEGDVPSEFKGGYISASTSKQINVVLDH